MSLPLEEKLVGRGISGGLTAATIRSPLTPLLLLAAIIVGLIATITIPREEEPQISVPMVDIMVPAPGLSTNEVVELVAKPLETIVKGVDGVEHVYTQAEDNGVMVTARFLVGSDPEDASVRINKQIDANRDKIPAGVGNPKISVKGINDVPIVVMTLSPKRGTPGQWGPEQLMQIAGKLRTEMAKVNDVGTSFIVGGQDNVVRITPDPARMALHNVPMSAIMGAVGQGNRRQPAGNLRQDGASQSLIAGEQLGSVEAVRLLAVGSTVGGTVLLQDVANISVGPSEMQQQSWRWAKDNKGQWYHAPAVSVAIAKRAGANAVTVSETVVERLESLKGTLIPDGVTVDITRNYGESANEKANELIFHLALATVSIVLLIVFAIGWREAAVTAIVIPTTIMLTMFASNIMGFTINRVSLFALIFSIGILVDDAIVMIENIARHWGMNDGRGRAQAAIDAVAEVGNPTIIATLTVVAALLPMLFVSGLMGPYMAPIPINASAAMVFSFFVAVIIAPWLMLKFAGNAPAHGHEEGHVDKLGRLYGRMAGPIIASKRASWIFLIAVGIATLLACSMFYFKAVTVKLLPFDNKSEVQLVIDMPEGSSLEDTARITEFAASVARSLPEAVAMESYVGTSAPFNFNGLVRHYFLRDRPEMGDVMITLSHKEERSRASHDIALELREKLAAVTLPNGASIKVVETPPGPPVMATLLAEVYGPDAESRRKTAAVLEGIFRSVPYIVDVDSSTGVQRPQVELVPDRSRLAFYGVPESQVFDSIGAMSGVQTVGYVPQGDGASPLPLQIGLAQDQRNLNSSFLDTPVAVTPTGQMLRLGDVVSEKRSMGDFPQFRRNGRAAIMVTAEMAGEYEAPIYGLMAVQEKVDAYDWAKAGLAKPIISLNGQPDDESATSMLWDGEWEITWATFRDMGAAFMVALLAIYALVVGQFRNFKVPLVILTPIPLTLIGIVIGHMLFNAPFTATSMIGFIALAGIIVRNSILLVDFINHLKGQGHNLREVLLQAGMIRFKPIVLTAAAAMIGAAVILTDPIFQGLAISLLFGLASSTLLTVLVIPAIYIVLRDKGDDVKV